MRKWLIAAMLILPASGCAPLSWFDLHAGPPPPVPETIANPTHVPGYNHDYVWDQIVDVVDDYFAIDREDRVRLVGDVLVEGRLDTRPQGGATYLEPHRHDSVGPYNRWESTLQTIRRRCQVRVMPAEGGYFVEVVVLKELEDRAQADETTISTNSFLLENQQGDIEKEDVLEETADLGWISQGRDTALEQRMLSEIRLRLCSGAVVKP